MQSNLFTLTLTDGLRTTRDGRELRYRVAHLRETNVGDERLAQRLAERVVLVNGVHKLLVSEADFRHALTMRHIEALECDSQRISQEAIDLGMLDKLSSHDLELIEKRIFLIELAAEVRYGNLSQADFEAIAAGQQKPPQQAPQPVGQAAGLGSTADQPESGPALLANFIGSNSHSTPARPGQ
jgi:phage FluMu protein gp41